MWKRVDCPPNHQSTAMTLRSGFTGTDYVSQPPLQAGGYIMTNPHWIATSMRNNCSCAELANLVFLIITAATLNLIIDHKISPFLSILFWDSIHKHCFLRMPWTGNLNSMSLKSCNTALKYCICNRICYSADSSSKCLWWLFCWW